MAVTLSCSDLGAGCNHTISGSSMDVIVTAMQEHAIEVHGYEKELVESSEMVAKMRGAVRQSSRPSKLRTSELGL